MWMKVTRYEAGVARDMSVTGPLYNLTPLVMATVSLVYAGYLSGPTLQTALAGNAVAGILGASLAVRTAVNAWSDRDMSRAEALVAIAVSVTLRVLVPLVALVLVAVSGGVDVFGECESDEPGDGGGPHHQDLSSCFMSGSRRKWNLALAAAVLWSVVALASLWMGGDVGGVWARSLSSALTWTGLAVVAALALAAPYLVGRSGGGGEE